MFELSVHGDWESRKMLDLSYARNFICICNLHKLWDSAWAFEYRLKDCIMLHKPPLCLKRKNELNARQK